MYVIGFSDTVVSQTDKEILHYMIHTQLSQKFINFDMYGYVKIKRNAEIEYVYSNQTKNIDFYNNLVDEIVNVKENYIYGNFIENCHRDIFQILQNRLHIIPTKK